MKHLPPARTENIVVQNLESETLIYNLDTNKVFCLNETSALVYQACNGKTDFEDFKNNHKLTDEVIFLALDLLKKESLLEERFVSPLAGMKRREVIKKIGLTSVIALPIISSLMAPTSAMAAISCGGTQPPGHVFGCIPAQSNCDAMGAPQCQTCSATATFNGACPVDATLLCVCD